MAGGKLYWVFFDSLTKNQSAPISTEDAQIAIFKIRPQDMHRFFIWTNGWQSWQPLKTYLESDQKNFVSTFTVPVAKTGEETIKATMKDILENTQTSLRGRENTGTNSQIYSSIRLNEETVSRIARQERPSDNKNYSVDELTWSNIQKSKLDFSRVASKSLDKREVRHELKIEVLLITSKGKTFRSKSKNISLSGSLLEDTIPYDFYSSPFEVLIINNHTKDPQRSRVKLQAQVVDATGGLTQRIKYISATDLQKRSLQSLLEDYMQAQKKSRAA